MHRLLLFICLFGCGTGGVPGDGGRALPNPGYAPYELQLDADGRARDLFPNEIGLGGPFARVEGQTLALYMHQCRTDAPCRVVRCTSKDGSSFSTPEVVAEHPDGLRDPFIREVDGGLTLWSVSDDGRRLNELSLDGESLTQTVHQLGDEEGRLSSPSIIEMGGRQQLFLMHDHEGVTTILHRTAPGEALDSLHGICSERPCPETERLTGLEVRYASSGTGRGVLRALLSTTMGSENGVLSFAASHNGQDWSPFAFNPALSGGGSLGHASQVLFKGSYYVFAVSGRAETRIVVAINERPAASQRW